jgi:3-oxoadipate enol-lactonase
MMLTTNGASLHCIVSGQDSGPWVTLAHGIATDLTLWHDVAAILGRTCRVLSYDARGHGLSEAPVGPYSLEMLGDDAIGLLDQLDIRRTHFVGLSLGGMVGLRLALDHPDRLSSLACCDARASAPEEYKNNWRQRQAAVREGGMETMVEPSMGRWFAPGYRTRQPERAREVEAMVRNTAPDGYRGCAAALEHLDYGPRIASITVPTLYLVGAHDQGAPPATMRAMHEATPASRYVEIADAGHLSCVEQPDAVAEALLTFFGAVEHASPATASVP